MSLRCIIVEDEPLALERAKGFAAKLPYLDVVGTFDNGIAALQFLKVHPVDLLFLDIHLGELSGIQLLEAARIEAKVILTTAYPEYALKGYELAVSDYLLKPYNFERFVQAVERVHAALRPERNGDKEAIFVRVENRLERVPLVDLRYVEGMRDYRRLHLRDRRLMTLQTFTELEEMIPERAALRVHKSWMVALNCIDHIERDRIVIGETRIPIGDSYRERLMQALLGR